MEMETEKFKSLTLRQLKELIEMEQPDEDQEIRVWVEMENEDGTKYLEGRRLIGITDDPNDHYICFTAAKYRPEEGIV